MGLPTVRGFINGDTSVYVYPFAITGVTKDSTGAPLGSCPVVLFRTADNSVAAQTTSDGSGNYRVDASPAIPHYAVAYKAGSPDVAGTTKNNLVGA